MKPFSHILYVKRHNFPLIRDSCDYVCPYDEKCDGHKKINTSLLIHLFKKLLFTMENATAADSSQSNISRIYI